MVGLLRGLAAPAADWSRCDFAVLQDRHTYTLFSVGRHGLDAFVSVLWDWTGLLGGAGAHEAPHLGLGGTTLDAVAPGKLNRATMKCTIGTLE